MDDSLSGSIGQSTQATKVFAFMTMHTDQGQQKKNETKRNGTKRRENEPPSFCSQVVHPPATVSTPVLCTTAHRTCPWAAMDQPALYSHRVPTGQCPEKKKVFVSSSHWFILPTAVILLLIIDNCIQDNFFSSPNVCYQSALLFSPAGSHSRSDVIKSVFPKKKN